MIRRSVFLVLIAAMLLAGCVVPSETPTPVPAATVAPTAAATTAPTATAAATPAKTPAGGRTLTVMTHDSFSVSQPVIDAFQAKCGCQVRFLKSGMQGWRSTKRS